MSSLRTTAAPQIDSLLHILRRDVIVWVPVSILVFLMTSCILSGFPQGLTPDILSPFAYEGDAVSHAWITQRVIEGWLFENERSGYPFGSKFLDYPTCDIGTLILLKCLGKLFGSFVAAVNIYYLLGFSLSFISGFVVMRAFGLNRGFAVAGALLFSVLPYHFQRIGHLFLTYYFQVPFFFYWAYRLFEFNPPPQIERRDSWSQLVRIFLPAAITMPILTSFGLYYAFFGGIVILLGGVSGALRNRNTQPLIIAAVLGGMLGLGLLLNIAPNIYNRAVNGVNPELSRRGTSEVELYGLKIVQLLIPSQNHRHATLRQMSLGYATDFPLVNENASAALGIVGAAGFGLLIMVSAFSLSNISTPSPLRFLALNTFALTILATTGGLSTLFAVLVTSLIRGWNRCSVLIGFACILAAFLILQYLLNRYASGGYRKTFFLGGVTLLTIIGVLDQTPAYDATEDQVRRNTFEELKNFISDVEHTLPQHAPVYQLPYLPFPEEPPVHNLGTYDLASGMLLSKKLRWSYAGIRGREGDLFFRSLSQEPIPLQIKVIARLGFQGIYIDRRGYTDQGQAVEEAIKAATGASPTLVSGNQEIAFYRIKGGPPVGSLTYQQILERAQYRPQ